MTHGATDELVTFGGRAAWLKMVWGWEYVLSENERLTLITHDGSPRLADSREWKGAKRSAHFEALRWYNGEPLEETVGVWLRLYPPESWRGDVDNAVKLFLDALQGVAYVDDSQVRDLRVTEVERVGEEQAALAVYVFRDRLPGP